MDEQPLDPLDEIIRELLLERTDGLSAPGLAAFIDGWGSLLRVLDRTPLLLPGAPADLVETFEHVVSRIRAAQNRALEDA